MARVAQSPQEETRVQHTSGPWHVDRTSHPEGVIYIVEGDGSRFDYGTAEIAVVYHEPRAHAADLLAAAPELLEALKVLVNLGDASIAADIRAALRPHERPSFDRAMADARAAIAKAEGRADA